MDQLARNVLLVFQPAEETTGGAQSICQTGIFRQLNVRHIFGIHLWPDLPAGTVSTRSGPMMARSKMCIRDRPFSIQLSRYIAAQGRSEILLILNHRSFVYRCCRFSSASTSGGIRSTSL